MNDPSTIFAIERAYSDGNRTPQNSDQLSEYFLPLYDLDVCVKAEKVIRGIIEAEKRKHDLEICAEKIIREQREKP